MLPNVWLCGQQCWGSCPSCRCCYWPQSTVVHTHKGDWPCSSWQAECAVLENFTWTLLLTSGLPHWRRITSIYGWSTGNHVESLHQKFRTKNPATFTSFYKANMQIYHIAILGRNTCVFSVSLFKLRAPSSICSWSLISFIAFLAGLRLWFACVAAIWKLQQAHSTYRSLSLASTKEIKNIQEGVLIMHFLLA